MTRRRCGSAARLSRSSTGWFARVGRFIRGRPHAPLDTKPSLLNRPVLTLSLYGKDGEEHRLEFYSFSQRARVREYALAISSYCGLGMIDQTTGTE